MSYPGLKQVHQLDRVDDNGAIVVLEDGARFSIYEGFHEFSVSWQPGQMIMLKANRRNPANPYIIINKHCNQQVEGQWLEQRE